MRPLLAFVALLSACVIQHGDGQGDDDGGRFACPAYVELLLDPASGTCVGVAPPCGDEPVPVADQDLAGCHTTCEALNESDCLAASACRAGYVNAPGNHLGPQFWTCWSTAPSGPVHTGTCTGLSASDCSRHDNCVSLYSKAADATTRFLSCDAEPTK